MAQLPDDSPSDTADCFLTAHRPIWNVWLLFLWNQAFTPAFGTFFIARNWATLGRRSEELLSWAVYFLLLPLPLLLAAIENVFGITTTSFIGYPYFVIDVPNLTKGSIV